VTHLGTTGKGGRTECDECDCVAGAQVKYNRDLCKVILGIWSWSVLQFTMVFTATKAPRREGVTTTANATASPGDSCCTPDPPTRTYSTTVLRQPGLTLDEPELLFSEPGLALRELALALDERGLIYSEPGQVVGEPELREPGMILSEPGLPS